MKLALVCSWPARAHERTTWTHCGVGAFDRSTGLRFGKAIGATIEILIPLVDPSDVSGQTTSVVYELQACLSNHQLVDVSGY